MSSCPSLIFPRHRPWRLTSHTTTNIFGKNASRIVNAIDPTWPPFQLHHHWPVTRTARVTCSPPCVHGDWPFLRPDAQNKKKNTPLTRSESYGLDSGRQTWWPPGRGTGGERRRLFYGVNGPTVKCENNICRRIMVSWTGEWVSAIAGNNWWPFVSIGP